MRPSPRHLMTLALFGAALIPLSALAQSQLPRPNQLPPAGGQAPQAAPARPGGAPPAQAQQQAPQAAPIKPYQPVAVTPPQPLADPSFEAFRKQLADIAKRKDKAALGKLIVAQGYFWDGENGDKVDKKKSALDNFASAVSLDAKDGSGWETVAGYAADPTASPLSERKGVMCAPADPGFDEKALEELAKATQTDVPDWGYPVQAGIEVRSGPQPNAPVVEKLGMHFVRVLADQAPPAPAAANQAPPVKVVAPSGKTGFVPADAITPLGNDQICYVKEGAAWKIAGYIGGDQ